MPRKMSLGRSQSNEFSYFFSWDLVFIALLFSPCLPSLSLGTRVVFPMEECKTGGKRVWERAGPVGKGRPSGKFVSETRNDTHWRRDGHSLSSCTTRGTTVAQSVPPRLGHQREHVQSVNGNTKRAIPGLRWLKQIQAPHNACVLKALCAL